jgi:hypothetical protein
MLLSGRGAGSLPLTEYFSKDELETIASPVLDVVVHVSVFPKPTFTGPDFQVKGSIPENLTTCTTVTAALFSDPGSSSVMAVALQEFANLYVHPLNRFMTNIWNPVFLILLIC